MTRENRLSFWTVLALLPLLAGSALGQGTFVNFEEPQIQPITVATVGEAQQTQQYLVVVNTPDNSVEIYLAGWPWSFVARIVTGLGPVTARWSRALERLYVCNFSGDSVSVIHLALQQDGEQLALDATLERTVHVGDEPSDIAFSSDHSTAFITLSNKSSMSVRNALDLTAITERDLLDLQVTLPDQTVVTQAVKAPRQIWIDKNDRMMVLNLMGEIADPANGLFYDLDLFVDDPSQSQPSHVSGLGSTNHAFALSPDGSKMFVVGTKARHLDADGVVAVSQLATGFVQSWLFVLEVPTQGAPTVVAEAPAGGGGPWPTLQSINLNRDYSAAALTGWLPPNTLSQPTDVVVVPTPLGGIDKLFITAFHSDKIARLEPDANQPGGWDIKRIPVPILNSGPDHGYSVAGPRGLTLGRDLQAEGGGQDSFVFVANRLDNTVLVVSASSEQIVGHFALQNDPTPIVVRRGREHLYDAEEHSFDPDLQTGTGAVACASCHVDGRTDGLPWNLGRAEDGPTIPPGFHDFNGLGGIGMTKFPEDKGDMVTQNLLGLVNYPTNEDGQFMFTNAPYHWRGDKGAFDDFNEAFVNLQAMKNLVPSSTHPDDNRGLTAEQMRDYRLFINTLRHPPNPDQDLRRRQTGTLGTDPNDVSAASGTNLGLVLFHNRLAVDIRACADCHSLPDGSSNTSTLFFQAPRTVTTGPDLLHPIETAALRNLRQRENFFITVTEAASTGNSGLTHDGEAGLSSLSQEFFILQTFNLTMSPTELVGVIEFIQQFDTGIASAATRAHTLGQPDDTRMLDILEGQVKEGNIGLAAYTRNNGIEKGYWYDISVTPPKYREEGTNNLIDRPTLEGLASGPGNVVILQGCPLGTERRWASPSGVATQITDPAFPPDNITLEPMAPSTPWTAVAGLNQFVWQQTLSAPPNNSNMWSRQVFQQALIPSFGIPAERHEPPRRFRVTGENIRPGAKLHLGIPTAQAKSLPVLAVSMELYPTQYRGTDNRQIWETSQEVAPLFTLALLNGGFWADDVFATLQRTKPDPMLDPNKWNGFLAVVQNEDDSLSNNLDVWHVLSVQDGR